MLVLKNKSDTDLVDRKYAYLETFGIIVRWEVSTNCAVFSIFLFIMSSVRISIHFFFIIALSPVKFWHCTYTLYVFMLWACSFVEPCIILAVDYFHFPPARTVAALLVIALWLRMHAVVEPTYEVLSMSNWNICALIFFRSLLFSNLYFTFERLNDVLDSLFYSS